MTPVASNNEHLRIFFFLYHGKMRPLRFPRVVKLVGHKSGGAGDSFGK